MSPHKHTRKPINGQCSRSQASVDITQGASSSGSPMSKDGASKTGKKGRRVIRRRKESSTRRGPGHISLHVTIEALPDNVLLDIFEFYREIHNSWEWPWNRLVHVCQRWRHLVFGSPLRLDLHLRCISKTPVRETLGVWPPLPIEILMGSDRTNDVDNIIAALEHRDRVRCIRIYNPTSSELERLAPMMQEPFPALTSLQLELWAHGATPLPDMFLGGSAQRLQSLWLSSIPFPRFPRFLLSATDLSYLILQGIPHTGYISPETMVTGLSALTRLTRLIIEFKSPASRPERRGRRPPPLTRVILPALNHLAFEGVSEYLEELVARIDAPQLGTLFISFFNQVIFDIQSLPCFIGRAEILRSFSHASVRIGNIIRIRLDSAERPNFFESMNFEIHCRAVDWQVWSMAQICNQIPFLLSIVEQLDIQVHHLNWEPILQVEMEDTQWLELFRPFTAVRILQIDRELQPLIVPALQELTGERDTEVLPALDSLYLEEYWPSGPDQQAIEPFIAARQYSDHPVAVHRWERWHEGSK